MHWAVQEYFMFSLDVYRTEWFGTIRSDLASGLVVPLALISEHISRNRAWRLVRPAGARTRIG